MRLFAMAGLTVATIIATMLVSFFTPANAVVCAHGVYRAGCVDRMGCCAPSPLLSVPLLDNPMWMCRSP
jgi:hypothetical protein